MKKYIALFSVIVLSLLFVCCGCSSTPEEEEVVEEEIVAPVSDVTDGTGLQGTWSGTMTSNGENCDAVLALNSDNTFVLYFATEESNDGEQVDNVGQQEGTYEDNGTQLDLTVDSVQGAVTVGDYAFDVEDAESSEGTKYSYTYQLTDNTLKMNDAEKGTSFDLTRDVADAE